MTPQDSQAAEPCPDNQFEETLQLIAKHVNPSPAAVKSGEAPAIGTFPNLVAKLCFYATTVSVPERKKIICFVDSEALYSVASCILSQPVYLETDERCDVMDQFNDLVKRYVVALVLSLHFVHRIQPFNLGSFWPSLHGVGRGTPCQDAISRSRRLQSNFVWKPVGDPISPILVHTNLATVDSAPNRTQVRWGFLVFAFGMIPEFWGLGCLDGSTTEHSSASIGGESKVPEVSNTAPLTWLEENSTIDDAQHMAVGGGVLSSPCALPHSFDFNPAPGVSDVHFGLFHSLSALAFETNTQDEGSSGGPAPTFTTFVVSPTPEVRATSSAASVSSVVQSVVPDSMAMPLQCEDLSTFLSAFGILPLLPSSELSTLLHAALESKEKFKSVDCESLGGATPRVLGRLQEFKQVHGEFVRGLWNFVSQAKRWNTWDLEVQYFHLRYGVAFPPELLSECRHLSVFVNGFTILVYQLLHQQAAFQPSEV